MFPHDYVDSLITALSTAALGVVGWAFKRQGDTNTQVVEHDKRIALVEQSLDVKFDDLKELITARFDSSDQRLERVERKVLNGDYQGHHY